MDSRPQGRGERDERRVSDAAPCGVDADGRGRVWHSNMASFDGMSQKAMTDDLDGEGRPTVMIPVTEAVPVVAAACLSFVVGWLVYWGSHLR